MGQSRDCGAVWFGQPTGSGNRFVALSIGAVVATQKDRGANTTGRTDSQCRCLGNWRCCVIVLGGWCCAGGAYVY